MLLLSSSSRRWVAVVASLRVYARFTPAMTVHRPRNPTADFLPMLSFRVMLRACACARRAPSRLPPPCSSYRCPPTTYTPPLLSAVVRFAILRIGAALSCHSTSRPIITDRPQQHQPTTIEPDRAHTPAPDETALDCGAIVLECLSGVRDCHSVCSIVSEQSSR